ncbi:glycerophosphodiester phosphodiesterase (plasmid) [Streptomyces sp. CA-294286]|uniref:glycerophosphodiester phosphodiesterase n=1 Tax=Streptomyces sp. CA-294286 TaxID=3240070 RepID=UPI003D8C91A9
MRSALPVGDAGCLRVRQRWLSGSGGERVFLRLLHRHNHLQICHVTEICAGAVQGGRHGAAGVRAGCLRRPRQHHTWQPGQHRNRRPRQQCPVGKEGPGRLPPCVDHRPPGRTPAVPQNTLASLQAAVRQGAEVVETDVQFTKDGTPVLMHDETVDRMTDGTGRIDRLTDVQLSRLTVTGGSRIPTLKEALKPLQAGSARLLLEIRARRRLPLSIGPCSRSRTPG